MNFSQMIDKYLTSEPHDEVGNMIEEVTEEFSEDFFQSNEDWIMDQDQLFVKWVEKLTYQDLDRKQIASRIERTFNLYKLGVTK